MARLVPAIPIAVAWSCLVNRDAWRKAKDARLALATGYGMTMYRYGGTAAAAILERVE